MFIYFNERIVNSNLIKEIFIQDDSHDFVVALEIQNENFLYEYYEDEQAAKLRLENLFELLNGK